MDRRVCRDAFAQIHDFSKSKFYQYKREYKEGCKVGYHGNQGLLKTRSTTLTASAHLETILVQSGEPMPHLIYTRTNGTDLIQFCLPSCFTKKDVFEEVGMKMDLDGLPRVTDTTLYKIWNERFANFGFHKHSAFAKCTECIEFKEGLMRERRKKERAALKHGRAVHL